MGSLPSNADLTEQVPVSPFKLELVAVLDPRFGGRRTMPMYLSTKEVRVPDNDKRRTASGTGTVPFTVKKLVCSPMVSSNDPNAIYEIMNFTVMDPRFIPSVVQVCFTMQEAIAFRSTMTPTEVAQSIVASGDKWIRLKCYVLGCIATSSKMDKIKAHFVNDHPDLQFDVQKVKLYQFGGPEDPSVVRTGLTRTSNLGKPGAVTANNMAILTNKKPAAQYDSDSARNSLKRRRGVGVADLHIPNKAPRTASEETPIGRTIRMTQAGAQAAQPMPSKHLNRASLGDSLRDNTATQPVPVEDDELYCICMQPEDGRPTMECGNRRHCLLRYYHLDCIGLTEDSMPSKDETWYCGRCIDQGIGRAVTLQNPFMASREALQPQSVRAGISVTNSATSSKGKAPAYPGGFLRNAKVPKPSPSIKLNPWSADLEKAFAEGSENVKDFDLGTLQQARARLRAMAHVPVGEPESLPTDEGHEDDYGPVYTAAGTLKTPNARSWSDLEEQHLKEVVEECVDAGLSGEPLWRAAHPKLLARGVNRPMGGMKMRWCRGLREETQIDERRKKNEKKMITALQAPKPNSTPKTARFRNSGTDYEMKSDAASSPLRKSTGDFLLSDLPTPPAAKSARYESFNSNSTTVVDANVEVEKGDIAEGGRGRAKSI